MLITSTATFCGTLPEVFKLRSRSVLRPDRPAEYCSICKERSSPWHAARRTAEFRGVTYIVCGPCNKLFWDAPGQIAGYGFRFRFVERRELPRNGVISDLPLSAQKKVYKILLLAYERRRKRRRHEADDPLQEVNWMADESAEQILRLPRRIADAMKGTAEIDGDDATVPDDIALTKIRDLLEEINPDIFTRIRKRKRKRLS